MPRIVKLRTKNFLSLQDVEIRPETNNLLVGSNASGKSNILRALSFIQSLPDHPLGKVFSDRLGYGEVAWKGDSTGAIELSIEIEGRFPEGLWSYDIAMEGSALGLVMILRERLTVKRAGGGEVHLIDIHGGTGSCLHADGSKAFDVSGGNPSESALRYNLPGWAAQTFKNYLAGWQFHFLDPNTMKQIQPVNRQVFLAERGDNLAPWLATLKTSYSESYRQIEQVVRDSFPGLQELVPELTHQQTTFLTSRDRNLKGPVTVWGMADGQLCFIALVSLVLVPSDLRPSLYRIEELENHLNPRLIETLMEVLRQRQREVADAGDWMQMFFTTHSPLVVDRFDLNEILCVRKVDGRTECQRPADRPELRKVLQEGEMGLGDLWYSGALEASERG